MQAVRPNLDAAAVDRHSKQVIAARYWLLGMAEHDRTYFNVLDVMELALAHHDGARNGGQPEASHQVSIFHGLRTMHRHLLDPVMAYKLAWAHDMVEDPRQRDGVLVTPDELAYVGGREFADEVVVMSKKILGQPNPDYSLDVIFGRASTSVAKGGDREDNVSSMFGVFKPARLERYVLETADEFLPRLKAARRKFPQQEPVYENIRLGIVRQLQLIRHLMERAGDGEAAT